MKSSPHWENGFSIDIGCNGIVDFFIFPETCWQDTHFLIAAYASLKIDGK
jgi:hypothetical protein